MAAFVTLQEYQQWTGAELDGLQAGQVDLQLTAACDDVRRYLHQQLDYIEDDVYLCEGHGTRAIELPQLPVVTVSEVTLAGTVITDWRRGAAADYQDSILFRALSDACCWRPVWPWRSQIVVTYTHGYPEGTVPENIKRAAVNLARISFEAAGRTTGISSETVGPFTTSYLSPADQAEADLTLNTLARAVVHPVPVI